MGVFWKVLEAVLVFLSIGVLGFIIVSRRVVHQESLRSISSLAIDIALPCMIFSNIMRNFHPNQYPHWWTLPLWWLLFTSISLILSLASSTLFRYRKETFLSLFFQNAMFFPFVVLSELYGESSIYVIYLFLFTLFYPALLFSVSYILLGVKGEIDWYKIFNPVTLTTILSLLLKITPLSNFVPRGAVIFSEKIGAMAIPLLMIVIGGNVFLQYKRIKDIWSFDALKFTVIKNFLFPATFLIVLKLIPMPKEIALIFLLEAAAPPVTVIPIIVERADGNHALVNQYLLYSFLASVISIPTSVAIFERIFG